MSDRETTKDLLARLRRHYIKPGEPMPGGIFVPECGINGGIQSRCGQQRRRAVRRVDRQPNRQSRQEISMKIRSDRAELADAVGWVSHATPKRPTAPALSGVKITADAETVTLQAFDYESSFTAVVSCDVPSAGECLVSAHLLREILAAMKGGTVELTLDDSRLKVACGKSEYRIGVMVLDEYPSLPKFPKPVGKVARDDLAALIGTVEHAASKDEAIPAICVAHLTGQVGRLRAVTTDRFRIAEASIMWNVKGATGKSPATFEASVPIQALTGALKGLSGPLEVGYSAHLFGLSDGSRTVTTRCVTDDFPNIDPFLALEAPIGIEVDSEALAGALKRADLVADEKAPLRLAFTEGEVEITADGDKGGGAEYIECDATEPLEALFLGTYLADGLRAVGGRVRLGFVDPLKPAVITSLDADRSARSIVMPRRSTRS